MGREGNPGPGPGFPFFNGLIRDSLLDQPEGEEGVAGGDTDQLFSVTEVADGRGNNLGTGIDPPKLLTGGRVQRV